MNQKLLQCQFIIHGGSRFTHYNTHSSIHANPHSFILLLVPLFPFQVEWWDMTSATKLPRLVREIRASPTWLKQVKVCWGHAIHISNICEFVLGFGLSKFLLQKLTITPQSATYLVQLMQEPLLYLDRFNNKSTHWDFDWYTMLYVHTYNLYWRFSCTIQRA